MRFAIINSFKDLSFSHHLRKLNVQFNINHSFAWGINREFCIFDVNVQKLKVQGAEGVELRILIRFLKEFKKEQSRKPWILILNIKAAQ